MLNGKSTPAALPHSAVPAPATAVPQPAGASGLSRRRLLLAAAITSHPRLGPPAPFSFDALTSQAQAMAEAAYVAPAALPPEVLERLDYEALGKIHFDPACALYRDGPGAYPVTFFHPGRFSAQVVRMFALTDASGQTSA